MEYAYPQYTCLACLDTGEIGPPEDRYICPCAVGRLIERQKLAILKLQHLKCPEPHGTGLGSCRCYTNDSIEEIEALLS